MILFWIIALIVFLLGFIYSKSKIIASAQLIIIWIFMGWNSGGMDFRDNQIIYFQSGISGFKGIRYGWLSNLIGYIFHQNDWDFIHYNVVTTLIILLIMGTVIFRNSQKPCTVLNYFVFYPFLDSVVQKRFFLGMVLIFLGIHFLIKRKRIAYLSCVILAIGFHFAFIIFVPLMFIDLLDEKKERYVIGIAIVTEIFVLSGGERILQRFISSAKLNRYIFETSYSSILIGLIYAASILGYIFICEKMTLGFQQNEKVIFFRKLNRVAIILVPMCLFESVYMRYYRILLLWAYILIYNENKYPLIEKGVVRINRKNVWIWIFVIYLVVLNMGIYCTSKSGLRGYIDTVLTNALFL